MTSIGKFIQCIFILLVIIHFRNISNGKYKKPNYNGDILSSTEIIKKENSLNVNINFKVDIDNNQIEMQNFHIPLFKMDIDGNYMKEFEFDNQCERVSLKDLQPDNIHIVYFLNDINKITEIYNFNKDESINKNSVLLYAELNNYHFHEIDPSIITRKYNYKFSLGSTIKHWKGFHQLYVLKDLYNRYGCQAQWVVFLDMDVFILDYTRKIESIIQFSYINNNKNLKSKTNDLCEIIAQDGPQTINTGVIISRISLESEEMYTNWLYYQSYSLINYQSKWGFDTGWFQFSYLKYLEKQFDIKLPIDCSGDKDQLKKDLSKRPMRHINIQLAGENSLRNLCYANMMQYLDVNYGYRSIGKYCILSGVTSIDRFNLHDWSGKSLLINNKYYLNLFLPNKPLNDNLKEKSVSNCLIKDSFLYHGSDELIIKELKSFWLDNKEKIKINFKNQVFNSNHNKPITSLSKSRPNVLLFNNTVVQGNLSSFENIIRKNEFIRSINNINYDQENEYNICNEKIISLFDFKPWKHD